MSEPILNRVYGILTNGDSTVRKTTADRTGLSYRAQQIVDALVPDTLSDAAKCAMAELYIRLCMTDRGLQESLKQADPINSYKLHSFYSTFSGVNIDTIVTNLRRVIIPDSEKSFLPFDYIRAALQNLLSLINGD